jgi:hypothetical protein
VNKTAPNKTAPSDFGGTLSSEHAFAQAELSGNKVILPAPHELFVDIDNEEADATFHKNLNKVDQYVGVTGHTWKYSKSGSPERKHYVVELARDVEPVERMLLQAVLGSDLRRELLSYCRWTENDPHPTLFFEKGQKLLT